MLNGKDDLKFRPKWSDGLVMLHVNTRKCFAFQTHSLPLLFAYSCSFFFFSQSYLWLFPPFFLKQLLNPSRYFSTSKGTCNWHRAFLQCRPGTKQIVSVSGEGPRGLNWTRFYMNHEDYALGAKRNKKGCLVGEQAPNQGHLICPGIQINSTGFLLTSPSASYAIWARVLPLW